MAYEHLVPGSCQVFTERRINAFYQTLAQSGVKPDDGPFFHENEKIRFPVNNRELPGQLNLRAVEIFCQHFPRGWECYLHPVRFFEAKDWMDKVPGVAWVLAIGVVTGVVVAVGVALVAGGLWLTDWLGWKA